MSWVNSKILNYYANVFALDECVCVHFHFTKFSREMWKYGRMQMRILCLIFEEFDSLFNNELWGEGADRQPEIQKRKAEGRKAKFGIVSHSHFDIKTESCRRNFRNFHFLFSLLNSNEEIFCIQLSVSKSNFDMHKINSQMRSGREGELWAGGSIEQQN